MHILIIIIILATIVGLIYLPHFWLKKTFRKYSQDKERFPGNGSQLAKHLLEKLEIREVKVESTDQGDHYDPIDKCVRLSPDNYNDKSLTAIVVAAHEVGHAIQHQANYKPFRWRTYLATGAVLAEKAGILFIMAMPFLTLLSRSPMVAILTTISAVLVMSLSVILHLVTLPVELDASFNRALPILKAGKYIEEKDYPAARKILKAAAFTYVSASLLSLLNFSRWLMILRK
jgi:Zn-dependent membrane protease YugP